MIFDMPSCGGCRTCELACSYHHSGKFNYAYSSIRVIDKENEEGFRIELVEKRDGDRFACDACEGLKIPACVEYCKESDTLKKMIVLLTSDTNV